MTLRAIILGCGSSMGVPRLGGADGAGDWGACDPNEPRNRRTRCSLLVQREGPDGATTNVLIDTSPDLREQLLRAKVGRIDAVLITHDHADQTHGIDDLRILAYRAERRLPVYIDPLTSPALVPRFAYCFNSSAETGYPAILDNVAMPAPFERFTVEGPGGVLEVTAFLQTHGPVMSLGFRIDAEGMGLAYSSDVNELDDAAFACVTGCDTWIVDALRYDPHPSHAHMDRSLGWIERAGARRGILTNLHNVMDYRAVNETTPDHVEAAYDNMVVTVGEAIPA